MNTYVCYFEDSSKLYISAGSSELAVLAAEKLVGHCESWEIAKSIPIGLAIIPANRVLGSGLL